MKQPKPLCPDSKSIRDLRKKLGLNQQDFWSRVGVTQSGGSRYESDRDMPVQVSWALTITYGTEKQVETLVTWLRNRLHPQSPYATRTWELSASASSFDKVMTMIACEIRRSHPQFAGCRD